MPSLLDDDFARGIVRSTEGQRIPKGGVYDCVNGLLDDDLGIYRRGGTAYKSTSNAPATILGLASAHVAAGLKTFLWTNTKAYMLDGSDAPAEIASSNPPAAFARGVVLNGAFVVPEKVSTGFLKVRMFGGADNASYSTGTMTATLDSVTVTGSGTSWLANVEPGMMLLVGGGVGVIRSVESNTSLTLWAPWSEPTTTAGAYTIASVTSYATPISADALYVAAAGSRLIVAGGDRAYMTRVGNAALSGFGTDDFHVFEDAGLVLGAQGLGNTGFIFTASGVQAITNMAFDITDAYGNPQQAREKISDELILWGDPGIAAFRGGMVVPGMDDVVIVGQDGSQVPISQNIRPLYRSYVKAGYFPGNAVVHRGHYFLPVLSDTSTAADVLVCRLDGAEPAWTRWSGHAACRGYVREVGATTRSPKLYGVAGVRVADASGCFVPASGNKSDADATTHVLTVITRDYAIKSHVKAFWRWVRARFELTDAASDNPTLTAEYAVGPVAGESWTSVGSWAEGTGESPTRLAVGKSAQSIRFRLKTSGACASAALRSLETYARGSQKR